jgi:23S rRNA U2552 (ribose-2'-O)-methylase RlmE/FtsJ
MPACGCQTVLDLGSAPGWTPSWRAPKSAPAYVIGVDTAPR